MNASQGSRNSKRRPLSELQFEVLPDWDQVSSVYDRVVAFLAANGIPDESINTYAMIACELVENGIKYGYFSLRTPSVKVSITIEGNQFSVLVSNPFSRTNASNFLAELDRTIQWVRGFQDPFEAYMERMKAISREPMEVDKSGLGIVRITREGRAVLDFVVEENNTLSVSAVTTIE